MVCDRLLNKIDWKPTRINSLTASTPAAIRTPLHFPTDRECLETIAPTVGKFDMQQLTIGWVKNSLEISPIVLSENLRPEIEKNSILEIVGDAQELPFDSHGNLESMMMMGEMVGAH